MKNIQGTAIIRDRGQLTIPDKIRAILKWAKPNTVISIQTTPQQELIIKPFTTQAIDWDDIWRRIKRSQSLKGKRGNLSHFIVSDREKH